MKKDAIRPVGIAALVALVGAGCGYTQNAQMSDAAHPGAMPSSVSAAELRTGLNTLLDEHVYLAASATDAALGGRDAESKASARALDANSVDIAKAIGSVYGRGTEEAFLPPVAMNDLLGYTQDLGAFLNSANPNLRKTVVADLVKTHILNLKDVVHAQAAKGPAKTWVAVGHAAGHVQMFAYPLAAAIANQFPEKSQASGV